MNMDTSGERGDTETSNNFFCYLPYEIISLKITDIKRGHAMGTVKIIIS